MLNGDDSENDFKTNRSNEQKRARFFVFPLPLFCTTTRLFVRLKRQTS